MGAKRPVRLGAHRAQVIYAETEQLLLSSGPKPLAPGHSFGCVVDCTVPSLWSAEQVTGTTGAPRIRPGSIFARWLSSAQALRLRIGRLRIPFRFAAPWNKRHIGLTLAPRKQPPSERTARKPRDRSGLAAVIPSPTPASSFSALDDSYLFVIHPIRLVSRPKSHSGRQPTHSSACRIARGIIS